MALTTVVLPMRSTSPSRVDVRSWLGLVFEPWLAPWVVHATNGVEPTDAAISADDVHDVQQTLGGDERGFERIVRRHQQEIAKRLRRFSRDPLVLEELVQETFVQAYFSLHRYRADAPLIHWLHRIAVRTGYRFWKAQRSRPFIAPLEAHGTQASNSAGKETEALDHIMAKLAPRDRLVLTLLYLEDRSVHETSMLTGWSQTMVKVQAYRARGRLRKLMGQAQSEGER